MSLKGHFNTNCLQITEITVYYYILNMHIKHFINTYTLNILYVFVFCVCPHLLVSAQVIY